VSLGSSRGDHRFETELLGQRFIIERIGTNGDYQAFCRLLRELDGKVDAIGLGGINLSLIAGNRRYDIRDAVLNGLPADLLPKRTGPQKAPKRTREVEALIIRNRFETDRSMYEIADELARLGFDVSARLVGQVLADYGLSKKNG